MHARITACGAYLPPKIVTNNDLAKIVDTNDEWIATRTGIRQRHYAADSQTNSQMASAAGRNCLNNASVKPAEVDMVIVSTVTGDLTFPSTAILVQRELGIGVCPAFDVQAACAGFIYGLSLANNAICNNQCKKVLLIGSELMMSIIDKTDRSTSILFGDGAGAVLVEADTDKATSKTTSKAIGKTQPKTHPKTHQGVLSVCLKADGRWADILKSDGGPSTNQQVGKLTMNGREVFRRAVDNLTSVSKQAVSEANLTMPDIDWVVPHQANKRILDMVGRNLEIPEQKVACTIADHANTSSASIPLALNHYLSKGLIKRDQLLLMQALGGGLTWGASVVRW